MPARERDYRRCLDHWNAVFAGEDPIPPRSPDTGNAGLDRGLDWLCQGADRVLDFGCGNGVLLLLCALRGAKALWGVDLSPAALANAHGRFDRAGIPVNLLEGGVEALEQLAPDSFDAVLLSNILDNLYPEDALELLAQCRRLLRPGGHILIKLNPWLSPEQIRDWGVRVLEGNLLDDGLLLWNNTDGQWQALIGRHFNIHQVQQLDDPEFDQTNRLILAEKI